MKLGTDVHHAKQSKFSYSAKPDFPRGGFGGHLKNGRYATISQKLRGVEPSLSTLYNFIGFLGSKFQKRYCRIHHAIVSAIFGGHLSKIADISKEIGLFQKLRGAEFQF